MAALPTVTAATPPATKLAFRSLLLFRRRSEWQTSLDRVEKPVGLLFVRRRLMTSLLVSPADERPS